VRLIPFALLLPLVVILLFSRRYGKSFPSAWALEEHRNESCLASRFDPLFVDALGLRFSLLLAVLITFLLAVSSLHCLFRIVVPNIFCFSFFFFYLGCYSLFTSRRFIPPASGRPLLCLVFLSPRFRIPTLCCLCSQSKGDGTVFCFGPVISSFFFFPRLSMFGSNFLLTHFSFCSPGS